MIARTLGSAGPRVSAVGLGCMGRTLSVCFAEVFGLADSGREVVATMLSTTIARRATPAADRSVT